MIDKLRRCFDEMVVYKDLKNTNFFSALSLPSFLRDWLLSQFSDGEGGYDQQALNTFVKEKIPQKKDWNSIKDRLINDGERVSILTPVSIEIGIGSGGVSFSLPVFDLKAKDTIIDKSVWDECRDELVKKSNVWGIVTLGYRPPNDSHSSGKIRLLKFKNFCPYTVELDYFKQMRSEFTIREWIDVLLGAVDYNANGYPDIDAKMMMLTRLLPFVEKRLNLIELAPKGTGKSYLYGSVSRYGWLSSGGVMSRAKMFYDLSTRKEGLIANKDFVVLDEVQTISFADVDEMRAALKGYMEKGEYTVGDQRGTAEAGVVLSGNISKDAMDRNNEVDMFSELPDIFHESALIDRIHGFICGWKIPRMTDDMKVCGWALNSEYFCSILHELRSDSTYRSIVDQLIEVPAGADTRDTEAVKRIATAYLKLLFPHVQSPSDIDKKDFTVYCFRRACEMRSIIKNQLGIMDIEYRGKDLPEFKFKEN